MMLNKNTLPLLFLMIYLFLACQQNEDKNATTYKAEFKKAEEQPTIGPQKNIKAFNQTDSSVNTKAVQPENVVAFAETLKGTPYLYGSTNPDKGFDCSGFITYIFNHFDIAVPRSSSEFTNIKTQIPLEMAQEGDLILFTGTDSTKKVVGHMGIINSKLHQPVTFLHATSGKAWGVTETPLYPHYIKRFMKIVRIFKS